MAAYRLVYDSRHLQADCQEPGSALEPYAQQSSMGYLFIYIIMRYMCYIDVLFDECVNYRRCIE